jgi:hypothetical protein
MTDQPPTEQQLDEYEAIASRAVADPFFVSDCEGKLAVWREKALVHVTRDEHGQIDGYSLPPVYAPRDEVIETVHLDSWDPGEDATDDQQRQDIHELVEARAALPVLLDVIGRQRAELAAVHAFLDEQELAARAFELPTPAWVEAVRAASVAPAAPLSPSQPSGVSESAQSPTGAATGRVGDSGTREPEVPLPDRLEAVLTERFTALGNPHSRMSINFQGPDGWPASKEVGPRDVAEVLRELLAATEETHIVADDSSDPEHVDDCPGCEAPA